MTVMEMMYGIPSIWLTAIIIGSLYIIEGVAVLFCYRRRNGLRDAVIGLMTIMSGVSIKNVNDAQIEMAIGGVRDISLYPTISTDVMTLSVVTLVMMICARLATISESRMVLVTYELLIAFHFAVVIEVIMLTYNALPVGALEVAAWAAMIIYTVGFVLACISERAVIKDHLRNVLRRITT